MVVRSILETIYSPKTPLEILAYTQFHNATRDLDIDPNIFRVRQMNTISDFGTSVDARKEAQKLFLGTSYDTFLDLARGRGRSTELRHVIEFEVMSWEKSKDQGLHRYSIPNGHRTAFLYGRKDGEWKDVLDEMCFAPRGFFHDAREAALYCEVPATEADVSDGVEWHQYTLQQALRNIYKDSPGFQKMSEVEL